MLDEPLIDEALLAGLSEAERQEALAAARAARRAEERAEQRALERAMRLKQEEHMKLEQQTQQLLGKATSNGNGSNNPGGKIVFVPKRKRQQAQNSSSNNGSSQNVSSSSATEEKEKAAKTSIPTKPEIKSATLETQQQSSTLTDKERQALKATYLGKQVVQEEPVKKKKKVNKKKQTFKFEWDNTDDTLNTDDQDLLYQSLSKTSSSSATGNRNQRGGSYRHSSAHSRTIPEPRRLGKSAQKIWNVDTSKHYQDCMTKPLAEMTARDWRMVRERFEISVQGGTAPPPMRNFKEVHLHASLYQAITTVLHYTDPTPIQRQAIPIGLERRDILGIAETGSGKTCAFGVPLLNYVLSLEDSILQSVGAEGPLALVLAPTRELALQIHGEMDKLLSCQSTVTTAAIVGGQPIQPQAQLLRDGVHIVVGTPGRLNDCLDMAYLVLNQCSFIVLDEADRMVDMGFAPQIESILENMGALLKSEVESEATSQMNEDLQSRQVPKYRTTCMFSATMPPEVERIAKQYLRHPATIAIGDRDSRKNARIVQKVLFLSSPSQKESKLRELLQSRNVQYDKMIVFVNEKKHCDSVGRIVERAGRPCVVLHGGKSQEHREEALDKFKHSKNVVLVATDVAGRGLDIKDVTHVINYDLPTRSIEAYTHRIGRTGRAGKTGLATSFITDEDEGIMPDLKAYLISTQNAVPDRLANHPAAAGVGGPQGNLIY